MITFNSFVFFATCLLTLTAAEAASIEKNLVYESPRIHSGDELVSSVINDCFDGETVPCLKGKVLTYLDTILNINEEQGRLFDVKDIDEVIYERMGRVLATREFRFQLPEIFFNNAVVSYRSDRGIDIDVAKEEGRGDLLKKKLLLPILLLLKLKMKALMPIFVAIIGLKAMQALFLSKLAITLVLGFIIYQLVMKKSAMGAMMPAAMTESPMTAYGAPLPSSSPSSASSYDPSSWEPTSGGGPYARIWEPSSSSSSHNLAYSSYYPSSSSGLSSGSSSSSSTSSGSGSGHSTYVS